MVRLAIISALLMSLGFSHLSAQNIAPNPGFELRNSCPSSISQFNGYVQTWVTANTASTDYSGCGFTGNGVIDNVPASGTSSAGIWGGAGHPSCPGSAYSEAVRANLTTPMVMGNTYQVQFRVRVDPTGTSTGNPNNCVNFGMYFYNAASPPPMTGWCCHPVTPQYSVAGGLIPRGPYATFSSNIVAGNWNAVIVGPFCNGNSAGCTNYSASRMYFNLDDIVVQPVIILDEADFGLEGKAHPAFHALHWEVDEDHSYTSFRLERSTNGVDFEALEERLVAPGQRLYQYLDHSPALGFNHYRLLGFDANGQSKRSKVLTLLRGENVDSEGGLLNYHYDESEQELQFSLDAGEAGSLQFEMLDVQGRRILFTEIQARQGVQLFHLPVGSVAAGLYVLRVKAMDRNAVWQAKWIR